MRVLVIDDDPRFVDDLRFLLPTCIGLTWAKGSTEAVRELETAPLPDAILLDLHFSAHFAPSPFEEGLALLVHLRQAMGVTLPILIVSSSPRSEMEEETIRRGANGYIEKPCSIPDLVRILGRYAADRSD